MEAEASCGENLLGVYKVLSFITYEETKSRVLQE